MTPPLPSARQAPLTFDDLVADLVWPRLLKAGSLALRPVRMGLAFLFLAACGLILALADWLDREPSKNLLGDFLGGLHSALGEFGAGVHDGNAERSATSLYRLFVSGPATGFAEHPYLILVFIPVLLVLLAVSGGAISRTAACDFCVGQSLAWPQALGFALGRWRSLVGSLAAPVLLVWGIALAMAIGGWALFSLPWVNVVGGLLWGLFLIGGLVATLVIVAYVLGQAMLVPCVACDGADAIDAIQHAYSFVFARPLRLLLYIVILTLQAGVLGFVVVAVTVLVVKFTGGTAGAWAGDRARDVLAGTMPASPTSAENAAGTLVRFWLLVPLTLVGAFFVSFYWCGATLLYLAMRRVADGQDMSEIWMPGMVEGTMAAASKPTTQPMPSQAVADDGPADET